MYGRRIPLSSAPSPQNAAGAQASRSGAVANGPRAVPSVGADDLGDLYRLKPAAIWRFIKRQPPSFWFVCIYLFFEYVRPQQIYESVQGPPYARAAIILAGVSFILERNKLRIRAPEILLGTFSIIVVASSVLAFHPSTSFENLPEYFVWVVIYLLISTVINDEKRFLVFLLSFLLYSLKMSQSGTRSWASSGFAFRDWGATGAPGFFQNSGEFGIQMCIFLPLVVSFVLALGPRWPRWQRLIGWAVASTAVLGIVASSSRGALLGLGAVALWLLMKSRHRFRALVATIAFAAAVYAITPPEQKARFQSAGTDNTSISRTTAWKQGLEMMRDYPVLGIGYGNWMEYRQVNYGYKLLPHNIFIEAGSELGYTGLAAFLALIGCTFAINRRTRQLTRPMADGGRFLFYTSHGLDGALVGFITSGFFVTVLYYPFFWINFAMTVAVYNATLNKVAAKRIVAAPRPNGMRVS